MYISNLHNSATKKNMFKDRSERFIQLNSKFVFFNDNNDLKNKVLKLSSISSVTALSL